MKIAHLSDLHVDAARAEKHLDDVHRLLTEALEAGADHIVITGDLSHTGRAEDLWLLRDVFLAYDLLDPAKLSVVVGNHDVYGFASSPAEALAFPKRCAATDLDTTVAGFYRTFEETLEGAHFPLHHDPSVYAKQVGPALIVGVNSVGRYSPVANPLGSKGAIDEERRVALRETLSSYLHRGRLKIVAMHHHLGRCAWSDTTRNRSAIHKLERHAGRLREKRQIVRLFREHDVKLVLHGHLHESCFYQRYGQACMNGGGTLDRTNRRHMRFNLIEIDGEEFNLRVVEVERPSFHVVGAKRMRERAPWGV